MIDERWRAVKRILAVRLDNLGDVLLTTPAIHAIKESLPASTVTLLTSTVGAQAVRLNPDVDDVIVYDAPWMDPWKLLPQDSEREQAMIATLRERQLDAAIIFTSFRQSPLPAAYLCYLADIPLRVAASHDGAGSLLTTRHKHADDGARPVPHEVLRGLDLVGALGMTTRNLDLVLDVPAEAEARVEQKMPALRIAKSGNPLVVIHPGCSMPARTYPWEMFAEVGDLLVERLDATILLTGSDEERDLVNRVRSHMVHDAMPLAGQLTFPELCALIKSADLTITNNTGPMHISAATKTPVVSLFALTNPPEQWGPWQVPHRQLYQDVPCRICYSRVCPYGQECLRLVSPEMVVAACADLLQESSRLNAGEPAQGRINPRKAAQLASGVAP